MDSLKGHLKGDTMDNTSNDTSREDIRTTVVEALGTVLGEDTMAVIEVTDATKLFADLQLGSIEVVALVEQIGKKYPLGDEFFTWVSQQSYWTMAHLTVGDIVDFIENAQR